MNIPRIASRYKLLVVLLLLGLTTSCVGSRMGHSWPAVSILGDQQNILVAYNDKVVLIDTSKNGQAVQLMQEDGSVKVNDKGEIVTWQVKSDSGDRSNFFSSPVILDDETMIIASLEGRVFLVDPQTADIKRSSKVFDGTVSSGSGCVGDCVMADPALDGDSLVVPLSNKDVVGISVESFDVEWRFETERGIWAKPVVDGDTIYIAAMDHHLYAVSAQNGQAVWSADLGGALAAAPALYQGDLYIGGLARKLYRISASNGAILDEYETENWIWSTPVIMDDVLYVADLGGYVYALDISDGFKEIWKTQAATKGIRPAPLVIEDSIIVGSRDGFVYWLERSNGTPRFKVEIGAEILSDMLIVEPNEALDLPEPLVIVSTVDTGRLVYALPLDGGEAIWKYPR